MRCGRVCHLAGTKAHQTWQIANDAGKDSKEWDRSWAMTINAQRESSTKLAGRRATKLLEGRSCDAYVARNSPTRHESISTCGTKQRTRYFDKWMAGARARFRDEECLE